MRAPHSHAPLVVFFILISTFIECSQLPKFLQQRYGKSFQESTNNPQSAASKTPFTKTKTSGRNYAKKVPTNRQNTSSGDSGYYSYSTINPLSWSFDGGCTGPPPAPKNAGLKCSPHNGCEAECSPDYFFPNGKKKILIHCKDQMWHVSNSEWGDILPSCEPKCVIPCQNQGICIAPNRCDCPDGFKGPQCQYENKPCLNLPPMPINSKRFCRSDMCTISCANGYEFPDGSAIATMVCKGGFWVPSKEKWTIIPDCQATCNPPCENGGFCLSFNVCQCPKEFRGSQCQYHEDACSAKKLPINGGYSCNGDGKSVSCSISCPDGVDFEFQPEPVYTCRYSDGIFLPSRIPKCVYEKDVILIEQPGSSSYYSYTNSKMEHYQMPLSKTLSDHVTNANNPESEIHYNTSIPHLHHTEAGKNPQTYVTVEEYLPEPKSCFNWGGTHYKTFDGKIYSFESKCSHVLVKDGVDNTFSIVTQNHQDCYSDLTRCYKIIKIYFQDKQYFLKRSPEGVPIFSSIKRTLPIPGQVPGIRVEMSAHHIVVSLDSVGAKIRWDGWQFVQIEAIESLWNRTQGLCGIMDGDMRNDISTAEGRIPKNIKTLAISWKADDLDSQCLETPREELVCHDTGVKDTMPFKASKFCKELLADRKFAPCQSVMDISSLLEACRSDYCRCTDNDRSVCACETVEVYVRDCTFQGVSGLINWRDENTCPMQCTGGKIYKACGSAKGQAVCGATVELPDNKEPCVEGCYCPDGTILHDDMCIKREKCPCRLRGKSFAAGSSVPKDCNTCTCVEGQWKCTQVSCGSRCSAIGDPHYVTFDGKRYDFMGQCSYYLVKNTNFSIEAENVACAGSISEAMNLPASISSGLPSCTKAVTIKIDGQNIRLDQNHITAVNNQEITKIPYFIAGIKIRSVSSIFMTVALPNGIVVWWDGVTRVYIDLPAEFKEKTRGLCGTFNNNQKDDFLTPEDDVEQGVIAFANKWKTTEKCNYIPEVLSSHPCDKNIHKKPTAEKHCLKIKSDLFKDCHWFVDPDQFYNDCLYDMCSCEFKMSRCLCPIVASYAAECSRKGIKVDWRSEVRECGVHCPGGQRYQVCGNSCTRTCFDISVEPDCKQQCAEGCNCPEGQALDDHGECIPIGRCKCQHDGMEFPPGYKEVRPAPNGPELCTCMNANWQCKPATDKDKITFPKAGDLRSLCDREANMEFTTCEPVEPVTCKNMHSLDYFSASVCHSGCQCKEGYVLDTNSKKCVKPTECPCHHGGRSYGENATVQSDCNTCQCHTGKWKCTDRQCTAECSAWGDSHYKTFDGKHFDYQGQCDYVLAKGSLGSDSFDVSIQNVPCGSLGTACSKSVTIRVSSGEDTESITLAKEKQIPKYKTYKHFIVREKGLYVIVEALDLGLIIHWDKGTRVYVKLDPRWKGRVKGLCGNYNNNDVDDFQTPSGGLVEASANIFGDSWRLQSYCPEALEITDTCQDRPDRKVWALKQCGVMKSPVFASCHSEVPVEEYFQKCVFDSCACDQGGDCECLCTSLAAYAQECNNRGYPIKWRSQQLCPMQCDERCSKYSPCISTCPIETCDNLLVNSKLSKLCKNDACIEGCSPKPCPPDFVYYNSSHFECAPRNNCKPACMEVDGVVYYEGDLMEEDDCHSCYCSREEKICKGQLCSTVTPEVFTTHQMENVLQCKSGWTAWINQDKAPMTKTKGGKKKKDIEMLPTPTVLNNLKESSRCSINQMVKIECRTVKSHITAKDTHLDVECSLEKGLICISPGKGRICPDFEIRVMCQCEETTSTESLQPFTEPTTEEGVGSRCPEGMVQDECAVECHNLCMYYSYLVKKRGLCKGDAECEPGCVPKDRKMTSCPSGMLWANDQECVSVDECMCEANGVSLKPGHVQEDGCKHCQCIDNFYSCNEDDCKEELVTQEPTSGVTSVTEEEIKIVTLPPVLIPPTVTPPPKCEPERFINLIQGDEPLPDDAFNASSVLSPVFAANHSRLNSRITAKSGGSWAPKYSNRQQWLQIDLGKQEPVYGVIIRGSPLYDEYVTSYRVLYSPDGDIFYYILNKENYPIVFRGSIDTTAPVTQIFETPIEAKVVRINPQTWNNGISLRVELLGCGEEITTTPKGTGWTTEKPVRVKPQFCDDSMGLNDGKMGDHQISTSSDLSRKYDKTKLKLNGDSAWQPLSDSTTEWIQFDFLEPRNITGLVTKGGPDGWVTAYLVKYSQNQKDWNPILDNNKHEKIFPGNYDNNSPQVTNFLLPINTRYVRIIPLKWRNKIQMRAEMHGCYKPYPIVEIPTTTISPLACNICPGVEAPQIELDACRCLADLWWDGENCINRTQCPCMVGHIPYSVGAIFEEEDCSRCTCKLGGVPHCTPKKCDKCKEDFRSTITATCACTCQPCPTGTLLCPTSNICINQTLWCDGVENCPDDEIACEVSELFQKPVTLTTLTHEVKPIKKCLQVICKPGYARKELKPSKTDNYHQHVTAMLSRQGKKKSGKYVGLKTGGKGGKKGYSDLRSKDLPKPLPVVKDLLEETVCKEYICVSTKPPPTYRYDESECPKKICQENFIPVIDQTYDKKTKTCPEYSCYPPPEPDAVCNVTGRTFNTFDNTEYKYDICNHVLARDLETDDWDIILKKECKTACSRILIIRHHYDIFVLRRDLSVELNGYSYTVDQIKNIGGLQNEAFSISQLGKTLLFLSNQYGFWIIWNTLEDVKLGVVYKLTDKVDGLCGFFNDNPDDDKRMPDGSPAKTSVEFGDSWAIDEDDGEPVVCKTKTCPMSVQDEAWKMCNHVKDHPLSLCARVLDIEAFVSRCLESTCTCLQEALENHTAEAQCRCEAMQAFVVDCLSADSAIDLSDWRMRQDCPVTCDSPQVYHDCYQRKCEPTCQSISDPNACPKINNICFPGCYCPPGFVKKGETCIPSTSCRDCECNVLPHLQYITYDEKNFTVNGNCVYVMSRDVLMSNEHEHKFQVLITNHPCKDNQEKMCVGKVTILYDGHKIHVLLDEHRKKLKLIVDSERITDFSEISQWAQTRETPTKHLKLLLTAVQVEISVYYPSLGVSVKTPSHNYRGKLEGLCGNCNGDVDDDIITPKGDKLKDINDFVLSWLYENLPGGQSKEQCQNKPEEKCPPLPEDSDPCAQLVDVQKFGQCLNILDPSLFIDWCKRDICGNHSERACSAIESYARDCANAGFCINWRNEYCPAQNCPADQFYDPCGTSSPDTCETIKQKDTSNGKKKSIPTEGCYCPEGKVFLNQTCVIPKNCEVCDNEGHHPGDRWKKDKCTTCTCEGTSLKCETQNCPGASTICEKGYNAVKLPTSRDECCDKYACVPEPTAGPTCEPPQKLICGPSQVMKMDTKPNGCQIFICECIPLDQCKPVNLTSPVPLEPGYEIEEDNSGCCPVVNVVCNKEKCPDPKECPQYHSLKTEEIKGRCCPIYMCEPPKDKCIYETQYAAGKTGGERFLTKYEKQNLLKGVNETWQDGPCRDCTCELTNAGKYQPTCSRTECTPLKLHSDYKHYELVFEPVFEQCCPNIIRKACKYNGKVYNVGEKWLKPNDYCTTLECVEGLNGANKETRVKSCDEECELGSEYMKPTEESKQCCGTCKQVACVVKDAIYHVGDEWTSDDRCTKYACLNTNGSMQVQAEVVTCPHLSKEYKNNFVIEMLPVEGECCLKHVQTACKEGDTVYKIGEKWPSPDGNKCKTVSCVEKVNRELVKQESLETCKTDCAKGWEYQESNDTCCGTCVQVACVVDGLTRHANESWYSPDNCTTFTCEYLDDQFIVLSQHVSCPSLDKCPEEHIYVDGCCKACNLTASTQTICGVEPIYLGKTVGMISHNSTDHGQCVNKKPIPNITECIGNCHSSTFFNRKSGSHESVCSCCQATEYISISIELECSDGEVWNKTMSVPSKCSCESCSSNQETSTETAAKTAGVKT